MISRIASTSRPVTSSSATSADSKPCRRSVSSAAGPVTCAVNPSPPLAMLRTSSVTSLIACCVVALIGMTVNAVPPSWETRPSGAPELNAATGGSTPLTSPILAAWSAIACLSASVSPPARW